MSSFFKYHNETKITCEVPNIVASHVVFGVPSRTCAGNGICKVYSIHASTRLKIPCEMVPVQLSLDSNYFSLRIPVAVCSQTLIQQHFSDTYFLMEEDFCLPLNLSKLIQKQHVCVLAGTYPYTNQHGFIWVKLPLTSQ